MKYSLFLLTAFLLNSCQNALDQALILDSYSSERELEQHVKGADLSEGESLKLESPRTATPPPAPNESISDFDTNNSMIIREGNISIETFDLQGQKARIDSLIKEYEGYYQNEDFYTQPNQSSYQLKLRIPNEKFDQFIDLLVTTTDQITQRDINAKDVTEEYIDIEMRMVNNEIYLKRYLELLDKAKTIKDMISIQDKVRLLQAEIESMKGRLNYLQNRTFLSTLTVNITHKHPVIAHATDDHFITRISTSFILGYNILIEACLAIVSVWPVALFIILGRWIFKKYTKFKLPFVES